MANALDKVLKTLGSLCWTEWLAYGTVAVVLHSTYKLVVVAFSDADLQVQFDSAVLKPKKSKRFYFSEDLNIIENNSSMHVHVVVANMVSEFKNCYDVMIFCFLQNQAWFVLK
jgi:hypothetical protein